MSIACDARVVLTALLGVPIVEPGANLGELLTSALGTNGIHLASGDVVVVTSKLVSRAEGRFVDLATVSPGAEATALAARTRKDPRFVELVLRESVSISRAAHDVLIVRHRLGFVCANAGIDASNAVPAGADPSSGPWVLLLPSDPDASAGALGRSLAPEGGIGVILSDSFGRPFRLGTVGVAVGVSGVPPLWDQRGDTDLFGRTLEHTVTALADQIAAAADLVAGQAREGRAVVHVRGLTFTPVAGNGARELSRAPGEDLYA